MSSVVLAGDTSGSGTITVPAVAGSFTATIGSATGTHYPFTAGTSVASTSGTSIDFTSIPSWVKRITVMFNGVSTSGTSVVQLQIGSGSVTTSGYTGGAYLFISTPGISVSSLSAGFAIEVGSGSLTASTVRFGSVVLTLQTGNTWVASGFIGHTGTSTGGAVGGQLALSGALDRVRVTTAAGTDTFDAGSINILYE
jgi:hypothetical protein